MRRNTAFLPRWRTGGTFELRLEGAAERLLPLLRESGGHRWQRVPPTERKGRVHTSTVTVAVFEIPEASTWALRDADIETFTTRDTGPGGQHRNKTESCVVMRHLPTGIQAKSALKSQHQNRQIAREVLEARVAEHYLRERASAEIADRRSKVGSGMRGDKIRTYREQDDRVTDHRTGRTARLRDVRDGQIGALSE